MKKFLKVLFPIIALVFVAAVTVLAINEPGLALALGVFPVSFAPLKRKCGLENMGGYKNKLLFIPECSVTTVPELPTDITQPEDLATATGSFTFKEEGAKPILIEATDKTVKLDGENQGDIDGQSFLQKVEFFHPGQDIKMSAFARYINNTPGYFIVEGLTGKQYMVGSKGLPAHTKPGFTGGGERTERKGFQFAFEADSFAPFIELGTPIDFDEIENPVIP